MTRRTGPKPRRFRFREEWLTAKEVAERIGLSLRTVYGRVSGDRILEGEELVDPYQPFRDGAVLITHGGSTRCVAEWARRTGIAEGTIRSRIDRGWTPADALTVALDDKREMTRPHRNRRAIKRIVRTFGGIKLTRMGITGNTIIPTTTGGYIKTSTIQPRTGAPRTVNDLHSNMGASA